ncbi:MAG: hypothetical protein ACLQIB_29630 [Isosphaeraceae bacterium]
MSDQRKDAGKADPKAEPEKKDADNAILTDAELQSVSGGAVVKGHQPPPPSPGNTPF